MSAKSHYFRSSQLRRAVRDLVELRILSPETGEELRAALRGTTAGYVCAHAEFAEFARCLGSANVLDYALATLADEREEIGATEAFMERVVSRGLVSVN